jgi:hypothetical protein
MGTRKYIEQNLYMEKRRQEKKWFLKIWSDQKLKKSYSEWEMINSENLFLFNISKILYFIQGESSNLIYSISEAYTVRARKHSNKFFYFYVLQYTLL